MSPLLLDGATGTELIRRGVAIASPDDSRRAVLDAGDTLAAIHRDYVDAGAELITANTTCTVGDPESTRRAVQLALEAARGRARVAAAITPLPTATLDARREHARVCAEAGAEFLLLETHIDLAGLRESLECTEALGLPRWVSLVPGAGDELLGEGSLSVAVSLAKGAGVEVVAANCFDASRVDEVANTLAALCPNAAWGLYPSITDLSPEAFAALMRGALERGAHLVGGCCGTTPAHIQALRAGTDSTRSSSGQ